MRWDYHQLLALLTLNAYALSLVASTDANEPKVQYEFDSELPIDTLDPSVGIATTNLAEVFSDRVPTEHLRYIFSENMFMSEAKGLTHWFIVYDGAKLHAWNIVRNVRFDLLQYTNLKAMAVDTVHGYLFLTDGSSIQRWQLVVSLGADKMSPTIKTTGGYVTQYQDTETILAITVDADQSALYVATTAGITVVMYQEPMSRNFMLYEDYQATSMAVNLVGDLFMTNGPTLNRAKADETGKIKTESEYFDSYANLWYKENELYFVGAEPSRNQGVYMKPVLHGQAPAELLVEISP